MGLQKKKYLIVIFIGLIYCPFWELLAQDMEDVPAIAINDSIKTDTTGVAETDSTAVQKEEAENGISFECTCEELFVEYYKTKKDDDRLITDYFAFCNGVREACTIPGLGIKKPVEKFEIHTCTRYAYEQKGVNLLAVGKTDDPKKLDEIAGYNFVSSKRIKEKMGDLYEDLGQRDQLYFGPEDIFNEGFYELFNNSMIAKKVKGDAGKIKLKLENGYLFADYLDKMKIIDRSTGVEFRFNDLRKGLVLPISERDRKDHSKLLSFFLKDFNDPYFCRALDMPDAFIVWVNLKKFFGVK